MGEKHYVLRVRKHDMEHSLDRVRHVVFDGDGCLCTFWPFGGDEDKEDVRRLAQFGAAIRLLFERENPLGLSDDSEYVYIPYMLPAEVVELIDRVLGADE